MLKEAGKFTQKIFLECYSMYSPLPVKRDVCLPLTSSLISQVSRNNIYKDEGRALHGLSSFLLIISHFQVTLRGSELTDTSLLPHSDQWLLRNTGKFPQENRLRSGNLNAESLVGGAPQNNSYVGESRTVMQLQQNAQPSSRAP